jgi:hypothetical protein
MTRLSTTIVALSLLSGISAVHGTELARDSFDYAETATLDSQAGGTGFTAAWFAESNVTIQDAAANIAGADFASVMNRPFGPVSDDVVYVGVRLQTAGWDDDFMQLTVSNGGTGNAREGMTMGLDGRNPIGFYTRIGTSGEGSSFSTAATFVDGTSYAMVGKFSKDGGSNYNRVDLFVDPVGLTEPAVPDATRDGIDSMISELSLFTIRNALMEGTETIRISDLRIATSFAAAVPDLPEPSSFVLAVFPLVGLLTMRRRRG